MPRPLCGLRVVCAPTVTKNLGICLQIVRAYSGLQLDSNRGGGWITSGHAHSNAKCWPFEDEAVLLTQNAGQTIESA